MEKFEKIREWYKCHFESRLTGRYITLEMIDPILRDHLGAYDILQNGISEKGNKIPLVRIGNGSKKILAWSQMHGNESTTTKAVLDLLKFLTSKNPVSLRVARFLSTHTLYIIPILNPDGAKAYTRVNANGIDLNRDFENPSQNESRFLMQILDWVKPDLCLNLHDQRSIYGFADGNPATISFLSPSADHGRSMTTSREIAMGHIVRMEKFLQSIIPGQVGRYDDSFNPACIGDTCQMKQIPTILFEAGHYADDYRREKTREFVFYSLLVLFRLIDTGDAVNYVNYFSIPENLRNFRDVLLRNVVLASGEKADIAIQFDEVLCKDTIEFRPTISETGSLNSLFGHFEKDVEDIQIWREAVKDNLKYVKVSDIKEIWLKIPIS